MMLQTSASRRGAVQTKVVDFLPAVVTVLVIGIGLLFVQTPPMAIVKYAAYLLLAVLLPGTLVHRALRGRNPLLVADLALGGATGLLLGLLAWAIFMLLGVQKYLWLWPLAVIVPFVAVPSLRKHWRLGGHTERSRVTSWLLAGALCLYTLGLVVVAMRTLDLLPKSNLYSLEYIDVYWHLGNAAELTRELPPDVPSVAGRTLRYHWFFNAHVAESHLISGVDLPTIMVRLWEIPVVAVVLGLVLAVARKATGAVWPGAVAALLIVVPAQLVPWEWFQPWSSYALTEGSPSQVFGLVPLLLAAYVLIDLVRGEPIGRGWLILMLAAAAAPGSKPSVMPVLMAGAGSVLLIYRKPVKRLLAALAIMVAAVLALAPLVAQSAAASGVKLFGLLYFMPTWTLYNPHDELPTTGGPVISGFNLFALMLVATIMLQFAWAIAALPLVKHRGDPAMVFLAGGFLASLVAALVVDHAGASEIYFARTGVPFGAILAAWGLYVVLPRTRRRIVAIAAGAAGLGAVIVLAAVAAGRGPKPALEDSPREIGIPLAVLVGSAILAVVAWFVIRPKTWKGTGTALFCATVLAVFTLQGPAWTADDAWTAATRTRPPLPPSQITARETLAARWVAEKVPRDDILATNVHCILKKTTPRCDGRAYWVSALTEHRILVESWAYTEETLKQLGQHPGGFSTYPFDDPARFEANERAFTNPTAEGLAELRDKYNVKWLFADRLAGPVSPNLKRLAKLRLENDDVQVYELRR